MVDCCFATPASYPLGPVSELGRTRHLQAFNVFRRLGFCALIIVEPFTLCRVLLYTCSNE